MSWLDGLTHRLRRLIQPNVFRRELEEEMQFHVELDALQQQDSRRFGNRTYYKEETRFMTLLGAFDPIRQDVRYAWRSIARTPSFTSLIVLTLALGLGGSAALFSFIDKLYLRPPGGIADPATLRRVWIKHFNMDAPGSFQSMSYKRFRGIAKALDDESALAAYQRDNSLRQGAGSGTTKLVGVYATANYFSVLGVKPALGRFFAADEDRLGVRTLVAVVSYTFWKQRLDADPNVIGTALMVGRDRFTIVGVASAPFRGLDLQTADVWMPLATMQMEGLQGHPWWETDHTHALYTVLRASASFSPTDFERRATQRLRDVNKQEVTMAPDTAQRVQLGSIIEARGPGNPDQALVISTRLTAVAGIVLLIACANVINLLLARAVMRRRETAVRLALGISRRRLLRHLTIESVMLATIAALVAVITGSWAGSLLRALLIPEVTWTEPVLSWRLATFTFFVALAAGMAVGIVPAVQASRPRLSNVLQGGWRAGLQSHARLRTTLLVMQATFSILLLAAAGLFVRSLLNVQGLDIGFDSRRLLFGSVEFDEGQAPPPAEIETRMREVAGRLNGNPAIEAVARTAMQPMHGLTWADFYFRNDSAASLGRRAPTTSVVSSEFFRAAGIRVLRGVGLSPETATPANEVVFNEAAAEVLWAGRDALGECIYFQRVPGRQCYRVVGIVEDVHLINVIEDHASPQMYVPLGAPGWERWPGSTIVVRATASRRAAAATALRSALNAEFSSETSKVLAMTDALERDYRPWRLGATLFSAFGVLAFLVATVGVYSTVNYGVNQRTHEFGVRMALGARMSNVLRHVVGSGVRPVALGVGAGLLLTTALGGLIKSLLYGVTPTDPTVMVFVTVAILVAAALAAVIPAWRATRVDPVTALQTE